MSALRTIYRFWAAIVFVAVLVQVGAAGYGAFYTANRLDDKGSTLDHEGFEHGWDFHAGFGYIVVLGILLLLVVGLIARLGRPRIWWPLALAVAGVLQVILAWIAIDTPGLGFLHPINALAIFALSGLIAHRTWSTAAPVTRRETPPPA
jgi:hypothetical protein